MNGVIIIVPTLYTFDQSMYQFDGIFIILELSRQLHPVTLLPSPPPPPCVNFQVIGSAIAEDIKSPFAMRNRPPTVFLSPNHLSR